ncbi:hypothetical protein RI367_005815 [Sorochytrium milnesiophthora]
MDAFALLQLVETCLPGHEEQRSEQPTTPITCDVMAQTATSKTPLKRKQRSSTPRDPWADVDKLDGKTFAESSCFKDLASPFVVVNKDNFDTLLNDEDRAELLALLPPCDVTRVQVGPQSPIDLTQDGSDNQVGSDTDVVMKVEQEEDTHCARLQLAGSVFTSNHSLRECVQIVQDYMRYDRLAGVVSALKRTPSLPIHLMNRIANPPEPSNEDWKDVNFERDQFLPQQEIIRRGKGAVEEPTPAPAPATAPASAKGKAGKAKPKAPRKAKAPAKDPDDEKENDDDIGHHDKEPGERKSNAGRKSGFADMIQNNMMAVNDLLILDRRMKRPPAHIQGMFKIVHVNDDLTIDVVQVQDDVPPLKLARVSRPSLLEEALAPHFGLPNLGHSNAWTYTSIKRGDLKPELMQNVRKRLQEMSKAKTKTKAKDEEKDNDTATTHAVDPTLPTEAAAVPPPLAPPTHPSSDTQPKQQQQEPLAAPGLELPSSIVIAEEVEI